MKKRNEDDPDNLGGLGGMLPAEVLKMLNELLERLHQLGNETMKESKNERKIVVNIYNPGYATTSGSFAVVDGCSSSPALHAET